MIDVSFIVPVYNAEKTIGKCIDSILDQDNGHIEILAINDGSSDSSLAVLRQYQSKSDCLRIIDKPNEGVAITRNFGIQEAKGTYIAFVDNDDYLDPDYLSTYLSSRDQDHDVVMGGWRRRSLDGKLIYERQMRGSEWETYINVYAWDKLIKREFIVSNQIQFLDYGIGEDLYFWFSLKAMNPRMKVIDYVGYTWSHVETSVSNTSHMGFDNRLDVLFLLDRIDTKFAVRPQLLDYYYRRFLVWHMLYSGKSATPDEFMREHARVSAWLNQHRIGQQLTPLSRRLQGEKILERLSVAGFAIIDRLHLMRLFSLIYCRGG